ncbi:MraY family glycosyltransferase [Pseudonocardia nematodicida]|uniref:MraY family glycosyltransferase n=1 Tax=Pseudonocardia nematodicida TaxID=1206997 RepID=A0ABV1KB69_9PSEU
MPVDQLSYGLPIRELVLVGLVSAVTTLLLTGPVRMLALKAGAVAWPRGRDVHVTPTPRWGGLAMFGGVLVGLLLSLQLPALRLAFFENSIEVLGIVVAAALILGVGMLDDRFDLDAITKFAAQVTAGGLLVLYGVQWVAIWIPLGGGGTGISGSYLLLGQGQAVLLTVLLTVGLVNAMNFVDGLDGLAAGIGLITTLATAVFCIGLIRDNGNDPAAFVPALIAVVLAGACLGFLPHNFNPARIFMGDTGSMLVGVMLAAAITSASGKLSFSDETSGTDILALVAPLIVLIGIVAIPALDLLLAVVRRTRAGTSPFSPDKMHLHHRLLQVGHSHRRAVLLVYLWVAVVAFGAVALALVPETGLVLTATGVALVIALVASAVPHRARARAAAQAPAVPEDLPDGVRPAGDPPEPGPGGTAARTDGPGPPPRADPAAAPSRNGADGSTARARFPGPAGRAATSPAPAHRDPGEPGAAPAPAPTRRASGRPVMGGARTSGWAPVDATGTGPLPTVGGPGTPPRPGAAPRPRDPAGAGSGAAARRSAPQEARPGPVYRGEPASGRGVRVDGRADDPAGPATPPEHTDQPTVPTPAYRPPRPGADDHRPG